MWDDTSLLDPEQMITGGTAGNHTYGYTTAQIVDQNGDGIITDADRQANGFWSLHGRSGVWDPKAFAFGRTGQVTDQNQTLATINFGGRSEFDKLEIAYDLSYSYGENENPNSFGITYFCDVDCGAPFNTTGVLWSSADPRFPKPQLPAYAADVEHRPDLLQFDGASWERSKQTDERIAFKFDAKYDVGTWLDNVKVGFKYLRSEREYDSTPLWDGDFNGTPLEGKSMAESGLIEREVHSILNGEYYYGAIFDRKAVIAAIRAAAAANPESYSYADLSEDDKRGTETIYAGYALADMRWDDLQVIAGARVEWTDVENEFWRDDGDLSGFATSNADYTQVLPSVTAIYRPTKDTVFRAAVWTSFSRPEYANISAGESITRDNNDDIIAISRGNPDLKPAEATNIDLIAEWYPDRTSVLSVGVFYKDIDNFIFTNGSAVEADNVDGQIVITQPQNGEEAEVYGVEFNVIKTFDGLGKPFDGFGVEANLTLQESEAETGIPYREGRPIPFVGAPDILANVSLTYQGYGLEAKLSYNYQGAYIEDMRDNAVDKWVQPNESLDFHSRFNFQEGLSMDFEVQNILDGHRYYTTKGEHPSYQKDYMEPGRTFILRFAYAY